MAARKNGVPRCSSSIIISDLHCYHGKPCRSFIKVLKIADLFDADCLVIAGDLFDDLYKELDPRQVTRHLRIIAGGRRLPRKIIYVLSSSSHDPRIKENSSLQLDESTIYLCKRHCIAEIGETRTCIVHGDIFLRNGAIAHLYNLLSTLKGATLLMERKIRKMLGKECEWLIAGHTHIPGIDPKSKVANPGTWKEKWFFGLPYWRRPSNTFIYFNGEKISLFKVSRGKTCLVEETMTR